MKIQNPLKQALSLTLEPVGFVRNGQAWYRNLGGIIQLVDLQKSNHSKKYYLNLAGFVPDIGPLPVNGKGDELPFPKEHRCHIRIRAEQVFQNPVQKVAFEHLLDLEHAIPDAEREAQLVKFMQEVILPFLEEWGNPTGLMQQLQSVLFRNGFVYEPVLDWARKKAV